MAVNVEMGKNNIFLSVDPPTTGQVVSGAATITVALFSYFYQGGLEFIEHTRLGTGNGLATVRVFPMALFGGETREMSQKVTTHYRLSSKASPINHFIRDTFDRQVKGHAMKLSPVAVPGAWHLSAVVDLCLHVKLWQ